MSSYTFDPDEITQPWTGGWVRCKHCISWSEDGCHGGWEQSTIDENIHEDVIYNRPPVADWCARGVFVVIINGNPELLTYKEWYRKFVLPLTAIREDVKEDGEW